MAFQLLIGLLFSIAPVMELRAAIPLIVNWGLSNNVAYQPFVLLAIFLNILTILLVFAFLDYIHGNLLSWKWYEKKWDHWVHTKLHKKINRLEKRHGLAQYLLLLLFIAIPIPGTGVWTSSTIAWILGLNRINSFFTLAVGAAIAGTIIFLLSVGLLSGLVY